MGADGGLDSRVEVEGDSSPSSRSAMSNNTTSPGSVDDIRGGYARDRSFTVHPSLDEDVGVDAEREYSGIRRSADMFEGFHPPSSASRQGSPYDFEASRSLISAYREELAALEVQLGSMRNQVKDLEDKGRGIQDANARVAREIKLRQAMDASRKELELRVEQLLSTLTTPRLPSPFRSSPPFSPPVACARN
jgi:hypothetical protein